MNDDRHDERVWTRRRVAREYRRLGYEVIEQPRGAALPPFLRGFSPDLVVMRNDDRAVVEVRTRESLIGSNEFVELAKAVEGHPGWRLELNSLGSRKPDFEELSEDGLDRLLAAGLTACHSGQRDLALIYLVSVLDELVRDAAMRHRIKGRDRSTPSVIGQLCFEGIIDEATADILEQAWKRRNAIVHGRAGTQSPDEEEMARLVAACREVQAAMRLEAV